MKTNIIKKQMLILSAIMIYLSSLTSCAGIEKKNDKNISPLIGLLSQNWLKPPSTNGKEKNPYQFL